MRSVSVMLLAPNALLVAAASLCSGRAMARWPARAHVPRMAMSAETLQKLGAAYPEWPEEAIRGRRELATVIEAFEEVATSVPLKASSAPTDDYRTWLDGGFAAHRFINQKLSRQTYVPILILLLQLMVRIQAKYPDLYAVIKFVPKKNGLNPALAALQGGTDPMELRIDQLRPREVASSQPRLYSL